MRISADWGSTSTGGVQQRRINDAGAVSALSFVAVPDGTATSPCFRTRMPTINGVVKRISATPIYGYTPGAAYTLKLIEASGASHEFASIAAAGDVNLVGSSSSDQPLTLSGAATIDLDDLDGGRVRIEIHIMDE